MVRRLLDRFFPRNACPMCGNREQFIHPDDDFLVCGENGCSETLYPEELVRRKTARTRTRYMVANHIPSD